MRIVISIAVGFICLATWPNLGTTKECSGPVSPGKLPSGVRELTFDIAKDIERRTCAREVR